MPYIGKSPSAGVRQRYQYTATAGQTTFSGTDLGNLTLTYTDNNFVDVFQNGVLLKGGGTDYTATSGTSVVLATGASVSDVIEIIVYDVFSVGNFYNRTDSDSRYVRHDSGTLGTDNFIAGNNAGDAIASGGNYNTLVGNEAGTALTTGDNNVAVGFEALATEDTQGHSVAVGYQALKTQNSSATSENTAVGYKAGTALTTGVESTFVGYQAGEALTVGTNNTLIGGEAGKAMVGDNNNVAVGWGALKTQTNSGSTATNNTAVGYSALGALTDGTKNTAIGLGAGGTITTGSGNTIIGQFDGNEDGFDIRTKDDNIVFSDGNGKVRGLWEDGISYPNWKFMSDTNGQFAMVIQAQDSSNPYGIYMQFTAASPDNNVHNFLTCSDNSTNRLQIFSDGDVVNHDNSYGAISDIKLKEQIADASSQWDDVKALKVRKFKMKEDVSAKGDSDALWRLGVVAQELETAGMNGLVESSPDIDVETKKDLGTTTKSVKYSILYMKAVKALQEAMTRIETLETKNDALEARIKKLEDG